MVELENARNCSGMPSFVFDVINNETLADFRIYALNARDLGMGEEYVTALFSLSDELEAEYWRHDGETVPEPGWV